MATAPVAMLITPAPRYDSTMPSAIPATSAPGPRPRRTKRRNWLMGRWSGRVTGPARDRGGVPRRPMACGSAGDPLAVGGVLELAVALVRVQARAEGHHRRQLRDE